MPIYAYRCSACGHAQDVLQKISDPVLTVCPACGQATYAKQVTAAGFQLKGSGWYVTDFRDGGKGGAKTADQPADKAADKPADAPAADKPKETAAAPAPAPAPAAPSAG
jgi:putative FmdB family regulatory protein